MCVSETAYVYVPVCVFQYRSHIVHALQFIFDRYGQAGWAAITPALLSKLGIPANTTVEDAQADSRMIAYQNQLLIFRVKRMKLFRSPPDPVPLGRYLPLTQDEVPFFAAWLEHAYVATFAWHSAVPVSPQRLCSVLRCVAGACVRSLVCMAHRCPCFTSTSLFRSSFAWHSAVPVSPQRLCSVLRLHGTALSLFHHNVSVPFFVAWLEHAYVASFAWHSAVPVSPQRLLSRTGSFVV
jgi:hypothetical protein